jgi:tetratricopeptide (TPR) repeat protein
MRRKHSLLNWLLLAPCLGLLAFHPMPLAAQTLPPGSAPAEGQPAEITNETGDEPALRDKTGDGADAAAGDAAHWFDRGILLSVYGNYKAAVAAFDQAIQMVPDWAAAHFQKGVAYGEMGQLAEAFTAIDKAIALEPRRGDFYYGRGRLHLMAGDDAKAMDDLSKAADLGNPDAVQYLKGKQSPGM